MNLGLNPRKDRCINMKQDGDDRIGDGSKYPLEIGTEAGWANDPWQPTEEIGICCSGCGCNDFEVIFKPNDGERL